MSEDNEHDPVDGAARLQLKDWASRRTQPQSTDGRVLRFTGRSEQFNIKVKPAWREQIDALAKMRGIGRAELLERIVAEWLKLGGKAE